MRKTTTFIMGLLFLCLWTGAKAQSSETDPRVDRAKWQWNASTTCPSGKEGTGDGYIDAAFDGKAETYWHSDWSGGSDGATLPQYLVIDLGEETIFEGFTYLPRPANGNGSTTAWRIYVSNEAFDLSNSVAENADKSRLGEPTLSGTFSYGTERVEKAAVFPTPQTGRYILFISDRSKTTTFFTCAEFNLLKTAAHTAKNLLSEGITTARGYQTNYAGTGFGRYDAQKLESAITAAEGVLNDGSATSDKLCAAVNDLQQATQAAHILPEEGKYYNIVSANPLFKEKQSVEKAIATTGAENFGWSTLNADDLAYYWQAERFYDELRFKSCSTGKYISGIGADGTKGTTDTNPARITLAPLGSEAVPVGSNEQVNFLINGAPMHAKGHNAGTGISGEAISYGGEYSTASAWVVREASIDGFTAPLIAKAETFLEDNKNNHEANPTQLGKYTTESYNAVSAAKNVLSGSVTPANISALSNALLNTSYAQVRPVFTIENQHSTYGVGNGIIEDATGQANHFTALDQNDNRMLWVISFPNEQATTGTFEIYNLATRNPIHTSAHASFASIGVTITEATGKPEGAETQYLMKQHNDFSPIHAQQNGSLLVEWSNNSHGSASAWKFNYVGTTAEMPSDEAFADYQLAAKAKADAISYKAHTATGLGNYTHSTLSHDEVKKQLDTYIGEVDALTHNTLNESSNIAQKINTFTAGLAINQPADGSFLRILSTPTNRYLNCDNAEAQGSAAFTAPNGSETIFYYKDGKLLSFKTGFYVANNANNRLYYNGITEGTDFTFSTTKDGTIGRYNVKYNGNSRYLFCANSAEGLYWAESTNDADYLLQTSLPRFHYSLEQVTTLPVTITEAGYATLCAPVALTIPSGDVKAYTGTKNGEWLTLTEISGTIPAGTPVILSGTAATYYFAITTSSDVAPAQDLKGTTATTSTSSVSLPYTLQSCHDGVGLYPYTGENLLGFKAYLVGESVISSYKIDLTPTGIEGVETGNKTPDAIFDLSGRRVQKLGKGTFIINGQKVIIK